MPQTTSTIKATERDARRNGHLTALATHPDLVTMVEQLKESHRMCVLLARNTEERARQSIEAAKQAGDLLIQIKAQIEHGDWEKWVKTECGISPRTARDYVHIAENWATIEPLIDPKRRPAAVLNLSIKAILRYLAKPRAGRDTGESDTKAASSRSEPDEQTEADPDVDPAKATAENTADAADAEDRPDRSEAAGGRPPMRMRIVVETKMAQMVDAPSGPTAGPGATGRPSPLGTMTRPRPKIPMRRRSPRSNSMTSGGWRAARSGGGSRTRRPSTARHCCGATPGPRSSG